MQAKTLSKVTWQHAEGHAKMFHPNLMPTSTATLVMSAGMADSALCCATKRAKMQTNKRTKQNVSENFAIYFSRTCVCYGKVP